MDVGTFSKFFLSCDSFPIYFKILSCSTLLQFARISVPLQVPVYSSIKYCPAKRWSQASLIFVTFDQQDFLHSTNIWSWFKLNNLAKTCWNVCNKLPNHKSMFKQLTKIFITFWIISNWILFMVFKYLIINGRLAHRPLYTWTNDLGIFFFKFHNVKVRKMWFNYYL